MWALSGFADEVSADLEEQCQVFNELDIGFVEFRSAWDTNVLDLDDDQLDRAARILAGHGLRTSSIGSPIGKAGIHDDFGAHLPRLDRALRVAARLTAPMVRIFSFWMPEGDDPARHRDEVLRRMAAMCDRAAGSGVLLVHENEKGIYGNTPQDSAAALPSRLPAAATSPAAAACGGWIAPFVNLITRYVNSPTFRRNRHFVMRT